MGHFIGTLFCSAQRHRFRWRFSSARRDGFGHVAFSVHDVEETCNELDTAGVKFQSLEWLEGLDSHGFTRKAIGLMKNNEK